MADDTEDTVDKLDTPIVDKPNSADTDDKPDNVISFASFGRHRRTATAHSTMMS